jgi:hypothetical protein
MLFVIPCGAAKLDRPAPARELYTSPHFRFTLRQVAAAAYRADGILRILSARHGLVDPDTVLEPYDTTMTSVARVRTDTLAAHLRALAAPAAAIEVHAFLPARYLAVLREAAQHAIRGDLDTVAVHDAYRDAPGIGYHRQVLAQLTQ